MPAASATRAHQPAQRVDLADQVALAETADRRVAAHLADGRELVGDERRRHAESRGRRSGLASGVTAANNNDTEVSHARGLSPMFHVNQLPRVRPVSRESLADAEGEEEVVQNGLGIHAAEQPLERLRRDAEDPRPSVPAPTLPGRRQAVPMALCERRPIALAAQQCGLAVRRSARQTAALTIG